MCIRDSMRTAHSAQRTPTPTPPACARAEAAADPAAAAALSAAAAAAAAADRGDAGEHEERLAGPDPPPCSVPRS
eukprot:15039101-Alexandrium_andersonii.AAC.1